MPEGCEVAMMRDYLYYKIKNTKLEKIDSLCTKYKLDLTLPQKILDINSKGKFLYMTLEKSYILFTFGLTGYLSFSKTNHSRAKFTIRKKGKLYCLYLNDEINYGSITMTDDKKVLDKKINSLSRDLLKDNYTTNDISQSINEFINKREKNKEVKIVEFLMNQEKNKSLGCGIGNYMVCELLYRSKISPHRKMSELSDNDVVQLTNQIKYLFKLAFYRNNNSYMEHYKNFIDKYDQMIINNKFRMYRSDTNISNDVFKYLCYGREKDNNGNKIMKDKIVKGRTTYWSPYVQN
uniref:Formamidopyrimidine-DNA glycosylase catalytic domain-containing protein n=1 Tax=viral metagenome TaxID=1070528 RepID=A0A6C0EBC7_9ZZZZ